jgi:hypothetical protein
MKKYSFDSMKKGNLHRNMVEKGKECSIINPKKSKTWMQKSTASFLLS